ncbi:hybrid sensor histidine kinase/response regulator [Sessilibacter corallicola]|uniref:histidine kinase n=1 Tax=Sessilibacter corallicola TaxID=2904075 RepID=A0ABQ0ADI5_9GAMM
MFTFHRPKSKVQKDRKLIHETDARIAKYSRRGLLLTVTVFVLIMWIGDFFTNYSKVAFALAAGLLLFTIIRGVIVFGFEAIYPRAPGRWRTLFFLASIAGAGWWGIIISTITYTLGFTTETNFLWLYTIVFYSGMTGVLSPYRRFLTSYLLSGLAPIVITSLILFSIEGYLYAIILILLFWMLRNQGLMMCESYWERLEANFVLRKRADSLEIEKRDSEAAAQLNHDFLVSLSDEFRSSLNETIGALSVLTHESSINDKQRHLISVAEKASDRQLQVVNSVIDYSKIKSKKLLLENTVFSLPKLLEECFNDKEIDAEIHGKEFSLNFSDNIPSRVRGDSMRASHLINSLIDQSISLSHGSDLFVNVSCEQHGGSELILHITIADEGKQTPQPIQSSSGVVNGFSLNMSKQLAEAMGGDLGIKNEDSPVFWLALPLAPVNSQSFFKQYESRFDKQKLLIIDAPAKIEEELKDIFRSWGLSATFADSKLELDEMLAPESDTNTVFDANLIFSKKSSLTAIPVSQKLKESEVFKDTPQVLVVSQLQSDSRLFTKYLGENTDLKVIQKPVTQDKLYNNFSMLFLDKLNSHHFAPSAKILLVEDNLVDQMVISGMIENLGFSVDVTANPDSGLKKLSQRDYDLVFMSCHLSGSEDCSESFNMAKEIRKLNDEEQKRVPLLGLTILKNDRQDRMCLTSGMDDTISKPVRKEELKKQVDHWLVSHS